MKVHSVLYILEVFPEISETFILDEILEVMNQGIKVSIVSLVQPTNERTHSETTAVSNDTIYLGKISGFKKIFSTVWMFFRHPIRFFNLIGHLYEVEKYVRDTLYRLMEVCYLSGYAEKENIQHLHAHFANKATSFAMWVHLLTGIPYTFTSHGYDVFYVVSPDLSKKTSLAKKHITISEFNQAYLKKNFSISNSINIYMGINLDLFKTEARDVVRDNIILHVGRLHEVKAQDVLIRACALLKDKLTRFQCVIIGDGPKRKELEDLIESLGLKDVCLLIGNKTRDEIIEYYQKAKVFVLSSISEGMPTVLKESLACGLPAVATDVRGVSEIIKDGETGFLAKSQSPEDLMNKIYELWNNDKLYNQIAQEGRQCINEKFNVKKQVEKLVAIWEMN